MFDVLTNIGKKKPQNPQFEVFGENDYPKNVLYISIVLVELGLEVMIQKEELSLRGQFLFLLLRPFRDKRFIQPLGQLMATAVSQS